MSQVEVDALYTVLPVRQQDHGSGETYLGLPGADFGYFYAHP